MRERYDGKVVDTRLGNHFQLLLGRAQERWRGDGIDYLERMRLEAHQNARHARGGGSVDQTRQYIEVAPVNAVECADRDDSTDDVRWQSRIGRKHFEIRHRS